MRLFGRGPTTQKTSPEDSFPSKPPATSQKAGGDQVRLVPAGKKVFRHSGTLYHAAPYSSSTRDFMQNVFGNLRYIMRQFRQSPVFTGAAILTLALGIGGTTAIFTLIHEVMLRSLPVADPALLYRIGEGDDCCVEGGPQDRWGMYSFPLYERLKVSAPEFEAVTAFQAGGARLSVRRQGVESSARPLRSEFVTGNYFSTLGVGAFGGRVLSPN